VKPPTAKADVEKYRAMLISLRQDAAYMILNPIANINPPDSSGYGYDMDLASELSATYRNLYDAGIQAGFDRPGQLPHEMFHNL
jgi:hypothetical protein